MARINFFNKVSAGIRPFRRDLRERIDEWIGKVGTRNRLLRVERAERIKRFGKAYINTFPKKTIKDFEVDITPSRYESPVAVTILHKQNLHCAKLSLGFERNVLYIYAVHGLTTKVYLNAFAKEVKTITGAKTTWADYLMNSTIEHARLLKFKEIKFLRPKFNPEIKWELLDTEEKRTAIDNLYRKLAENFGFKEVEDERFWVRKF